MSEVKDHFIANLVHTNKQANIMTPTMSFGMMTKFQTEIKVMAKEMFSVINVV